MKKKKLYYIETGIAAAVLTACIIAAVCVNRKEQLVRIGFNITGAVMTDLSREGEFWKVTVYSDDEFGYNEYFRYPETIYINDKKIADLLIPEIKYESFNIEIQIPEKEVQEYGLWLTENDVESLNGMEDLSKARIINIYKVLDNVLFLQRYCIITDVRAYSPEYYRSHFQYVP